MRYRAAGAAAAKLSIRFRWTWMAATGSRPLSLPGSSRQLSRQVVAAGKVSNSSEVVTDWMMGLAVRAPRRAFTKAGLSDHRAGATATMARAVSSLGCS